MSGTTDTPTADPASPPGPGTVRAVDPDDVRAAIEHCYEQGWTDGLPVVPATETAVAELLATVDRPPDQVLLDMPHLNRACDVRLAAVNAVLAGCRPEYFPVVLAALDSLVIENFVPRAIWQSTTGTAPVLLVNGPVRSEIGLNSAGNVFGSGFRANATIGRAVRLIALNAIGLRPHELDQATQGTPAKYTCCIAEAEELSPWEPFHVDQGLDHSDSAVTAMTSRSVLHIEARHTTAPEQLLNDMADSIARTGALIHATISACLVFSPEHARLVGGAGWSRADIQRFVYEAAVIDRDRLRAAGKGSQSNKTHWRLPDDHPDAVPDGLDPDAPARVLTSPEAVLVTVAGADNAGVSAVIETFGSRGTAPATVRVGSTPG